MGNKVQITIIKTKKDESHTLSRNYEVRIEIREPKISLAFVGVFDEAQFLVIVFGWFQLRFTRNLNTYSVWFV